MRIAVNRWLLNGAVLGLAVATLACDSFLDVDDPTVIDAGTVDPIEDLPTFASSALQDLYDAFDNYIVYGAWLTGEMYVGDTFPTRNDIGRRVVEYTNGTLNADVYQPIALAISTNERVLEFLEESGSANKEIEAGASFASAYAILFEAESFCQVVISSGLHNLGSGITPEQAMAEAIARFDAAIAAANEAGQDTIALAAYVGKARAHLFLGEYDEAVQAAAQVPEDFNYRVPKADDPSFRDRLGNTVWNFTLARPSLVVPPYYRGLGDSRIEFRLWLNDDGEPIQSQGNGFDYYAQEKYDGWSSSVRLASGLEARYIAAEAELALGNEAPALALIAEREDPESESGDDVDFLDDAGTLVQLLDQKARDFWLEGTHLGDWRRNPSSTPYVPPAGSPYYASAVGGNIGNVTCFPMTREEVDNNPNI